ncbi:hypothetical protein OE88DRAFT_545022 [Heliocybe sulcata]|uniref:Uncharacterized protein n=1 Tax=Heliocybe sulcata TaxID=5364 RepID=A0A5C3MRW9_9AGAM|nr:hypothetical protein OE88DRAFT_545022 [Heliocybe sulcata]
MAGRLVLGRLSQFESFPRVCVPCRHRLSSGRSSASLLMRRAHIPTLASASGCLCIWTLQLLELVPRFGFWSSLSYCFAYSYCSYCLAQGPRIFGLGR